MSMTDYGNIDLQDRVAVVTGAASGMGREVAIALTSLGARVCVGDINTDGLESLKAEIGENCVMQPTDITKEEQVEALVNCAVSSFGAVHIGVNCAGVGGGAPILDCSAKRWRYFVDLNLTGAFFSIKHQARRMRDQGQGGVIVNITSLTARMAARSMAPYAAAKAGLEYLTRLAAEEFRDIGVRVSGISPGLIRTPLAQDVCETPEIRDYYLQSVPSNRVGEVSDIASAVVFLVSDHGSYVNGEIIHVDGGQKANGSWPDVVPRQDA